MQQPTLNVTEPFPKAPPVPLGVPVPVPEPAPWQWPGPQAGRRGSHMRATLFRSALCCVMLHVSLPDGIRDPYFRNAARHFAEALRMLGPKQPTKCRSFNSEPMTCWVGFRCSASLQSLALQGKRKTHIAQLSVSEPWTFARPRHAVHTTTTMQELRGTPAMNRIGW